MRSTPVTLTELSFPFRMLQSNQLREIPAEALWDLPRLQSL